ncbi:hypothetical protein [Piscinibacter gummiphilus]|uniref:Uncharacterized protein n=1 Tax=Piscinibacter gummiphilus TaxID=946333 RepID=A0A1W6LD04_9BURK|nr:hypothetical protein [Piscinibacter gummiphilus]ARN22109.1 hypothetical protein A4W93_20615 [Piscinibacter gummiphilus]ATU66798.1 hypothetical protein CPZ87_20710 [Piscinibacter gummiphilus]GLS94194.1 hypothetical protein GCM10007918_14860 [Piscinibacter gummiphilus]
MSYEVPEDATAFVHRGHAVEIVLSDAGGGRWNWFLRIDGVEHSPGDVGPAPNLASAIREAQVGARYLIDSGVAGVDARKA